MELQGRAGGYVHCEVYVLHSHLAVYLFHSFAGVLHSDEGFLIDICGFYGVYLLLEHGYLAVRLLEGVLVLLLALEGVTGNCAQSVPFTRYIH